MSFRSIRGGQPRSRVVVDLHQSVQVPWFRKTVQPATLYSSASLSSSLDNEDHKGASAVVFSWDSRLATMDWRLKFNVAFQQRLRSKDSVKRRGV